jgi:RimJ/RimL family protein N-acetyltransferase
MDDQALEQPVVNIAGERIALGPIRRDLLPLYQRWRNDFAVGRTLDYDLAPVPFEERIAWFERANVDATTVRFTIYERATWRPIGLANLHELDRRHGTAEYGIAIFEADARGKGYGTETTRLMLDYAFTALGLHNVMLRVYAYNPAAIRAYEKAGFREFGRRRESRLFLGRRWDEIHMQCLASEFESPVLAAILAANQPDPTDQ